MNEAKRLAAWLAAHAKYMKHGEEQAEMHKAARMLRSLDHELEANVTVLRNARDLLAEMRKMLEEAYGQLPEQEAAGDSKRISVPVLWR